MLSQPQVHKMYGRMYRHADITSMTFFAVLSETLCIFPAGQSGAGVQTEQSGGCHLHGVSSG